MLFCALCAVDVQSGQIQSCPQGAYSPLRGHEVPRNMRLETECLRHEKDEIKGLEG